MGIIRRPKALTCADASSCSRCGRLGDGRPPGAGPSLYGHQGRLTRHRADTPLSLLAEEAIHHPSAGADHRAQLVPVHGLGGADI